MSSNGCDPVAFLQPDIVPAVAEAIHRQLVAARGGRLWDERLAAHIVPHGLSKGEIGAKYFGDTIRELAGIGVIDVEDGQVGLAGPPDETRVPVAMPRMVRTRAMVAERDTDLW